MKKFQFLLWIYIFTILQHAAISGATDQAPLVSIEEDKLIYNEAQNGDRIPDFSYCGYGGGGVPIPSVPVKATLTPGKEEQDDTERIQQAINRLSESKPDRDGFRGAILLKKGTYRVASTLKIRSSGIVLRGEGQRKGGTLIIATGNKKRSLIEIGGGKAGAEVQGTRRAITDRRVPVGSRTMNLENARGLAAGDAIVVYRPATKEWIHALGTDKLNRGPDDDVNNWTPEGYKLLFERTVTSVSGNTITIDAPIVCAIDSKWGGGSVYKIGEDSRINNVGIEHLRMRSEYHEGKQKSDESHGWDAIKIRALVDSWVRNVTAVHFGYSCVNITSGGKHITVQDSACLDPVSKITGGRRYSFALAGRLCLIQRCYTRHGRHDYVMHARVPGPNVFLDCVADNTHSDSGPHHRWSTGTLYDNIACGPLNVQNRGRSGTGHGWAGANMVFWNCRARSINCQKPPTANNYCIGCTGKISGNGYMESKGKPVLPRSLYLTQLTHRMGVEAVRNIAVPEQLTGNIDSWIRKNVAQ